MHKTGKEYENFVAKLQQAILDSEKYSEQKNIVVERNKIIRDKNGLDREFDLYWEYELGGFIYKTVIECKDYNSKIKLEKIDAFVGKTQDIPKLKLAFATKKGYQSGADEKAKQYDIDLLIVREQNDTDWVDEYGNHLMKIIDITINSYGPAIITKFETFLDGKWVKENRPDITNPFHRPCLSNETYIDDISNKEKYSIYDFSYKLLKLEEYKPGNYERTKEFSDAYIIYGEDTYKLKAIKIFYCIQEPMISGINIDFSKELIGVIEYINRGIKKKIYENGDIQQDKVNIKTPKKRYDKNKNA